MRKSLFASCSCAAIAAFTAFAVVPMVAVAAPNDPPQAKGDVGAVSEVIVTAQRRSESIQNVPISITAVTGATLAKDGVTTLSGLEQLAPGLTIAAVGSGFVSYTYIRGGGTNQLDAGSDPSVAYYIDDIYIGGTAGLQFNLFDIDHVEVLMGPQGTLFGRNAASGAISVVTQRPSATLQGDADISYGNYNALLAKGDVTGPLNSDGSLLFRVSGAYQHQDGYTKNLFPGGSDPGTINSGGVRGQLEWDHGPVTVLLTADYYRARDGQTNQFLTGPSVAGVVNPALPEPTNQSFFAHYYDFSGFERQEVGDVSARVEWKTPIGTVTSISAYRSNTFDRLQDQDGTEYNAEILGSDESDKSFSQELRLTGDAFGRLHYVGGLYYYNAQTVASYALDLGPGFAVPPLAGAGLSDHFTLDTQSYAAFGQTTYDLTKQVSLTVGGRYTEDDKEDDRRVSRTIPPAQTFAIDPHVSFHAFTPSVTLDYKPVKGVLAYLSYREGFKSGGFQALGATSVIANTPFLPEHVRSYEAGLKTAWFEHRLIADVALFRSEITDQQVSQVDTSFSPPYPVAIDNAGRTRDDGVDVSLEARPIAGLSLTANATVQDARFIEYQNGAVSYAGKHQLRSPDFMGYFAAEYRFDIARAGQLTLRGDYSYQSEEYFDSANTHVAGEYAPAYGLGNLRATFHPERSSLDISLFVKNVGDTHYPINIAVSGPTGVYAPGAPRTFGAYLHYHF